MWFGDEIREVEARSAVRVAAETMRSHRNKGEEAVEMWAISPVNDQDGGEKVEGFWEASPKAAQQC